MGKSYYVEFKTWAEGTVNIPWECAKYEEIADYRLRADTSVSASASKVRTLFSSMDELACNKFLRDYVAALAVGVILELDDSSIAIDEIKTVFGYCELLGICEITNENRSHILETMTHARNNTGVGVS
jgi:hypothetical protein